MIKFLMIVNIPLKEEKEKWLSLIKKFEKKMLG